MFAVLGALLAFLAVAAGAFGAHALRGRLTSDLIEVFETAVRYQMYHALASAVAGWLFVAGIVLFSGSLYVLSLSGQRWFGAITPLGGLALLAGWLVLAWALWQGG